MSGNSGSNTDYAHFSSVAEREVDSDAWGSVVVHVGMREVVANHSTKGGSDSSPRPFYCYLNGKPEELLVSDTTWNLLVFVLERYYKKLLAAQKKALICGTAVFFIVFLPFRVLADIYPRGMTPVLVVAVAMLVYVSYIKYFDQEQLMRNILHAEGLYALFARDGYAVFVERQPARWSCWPKPVGLRFERQRQPTQELQHRNKHGLQNKD